MKEDTTSGKYDTYKKKKTFLRTKIIYVDRVLNMKMLNKDDG